MQVSYGFKTYVDKESAFVEKMGKKAELKILCGCFRTGEK